MEIILQLISINLVLQASTNLKCPRVRLSLTQEIRTKGCRMACAPPVLRNRNLLCGVPHLFIEKVPKNKCLSKIELTSSTGKKIAQEEGSWTFKEGRGLLAIWISLRIVIWVICRIYIIDRTQQKRIIAQLLMNGDMASIARFRVRIKECEIRTMEYSTSWKPSKIELML